MSYANDRELHESFVTTLGAIGALLVRMTPPVEAAGSIALQTELKTVMDELQAIQAKHRA